MDQMATNGDDKDKAESKDSTEVSPSGEHQEEQQLRRNNEDMTPNKDDNDASKQKDDGDEGKISAYVDKEESILMAKGSDTKNGDQDENNIESSDSQGEPVVDDKNVMPVHPYEGNCPNYEASVIINNVESIESQGEPSDEKDVMPGHKRSREVCTEEGYEYESKKPKANPQIIDIYSHPGLRLNEFSDAAQTIFSRPSGGMLDSARAALNVQTRQPHMLNYASADCPQRCVPRPLPPILLEATKKSGLPRSLRHLDPNTRIDIFNRKTGKIMSGEQAIHVKDLPEALLLHSEYEPIVPPLASRNESIFTREGRSARNTRVTNSVTPQSRLELSHYRGRSAVVIKGSYRGYIGVIDECTPGGWYVLKDVHHRAELGFPLVVGPDHIELIPTGCEEIISEMCEMVKNYDFQTMVNTYQDYLVHHFRCLMQPLMDRIKTLSVEDSYLTHTLHRCQTEKDVFSRSPEEVERIRSRQQTVRELKLAAEKEQHELFKQSASARAYALHTFKDEEKAEAAKKLPPVHLDADTTAKYEPTPKSASLPDR